MTLKGSENVVLLVNTNYVSVKEKTAFYRSLIDPEERQRRNKAIPRDNISEKHDTAVGAKHFSSNFQVVKIQGNP